jgi:hypothetical protein
LRLAGHAVGLSGVLTLLVLAAVVLAGMTALNLLATALWPEKVERARQTLERYPLRSLLMGVAILLGEVLLIQSLPLKGLVTLTAIALNLVWLAQGLPALAARIGQGLALTEQRATAAGTALMGLVWGLPVLGWAAGACLGLSALGAPLAIRLER